MEDAIGDPHRHDPHHRGAAQNFAVHRLPAGGIEQPVHLRPGQDADRAGAVAAVQQQARGWGFVRGIVGSGGVDKVPLFLADDVCRARFVFRVVTGIEMDDLDLAGAFAHLASSGGQLAEIVTDMPIRPRARRVGCAELIVRLGAVGLARGHRGPIAIGRIGHPGLFEIRLGRQHLTAAGGKMASNLVHPIPRILRGSLRRHRRSIRRHQHPAVLGPHRRRQSLAGGRLIGGYRKQRFDFMFRWRQPDHSGRCASHWPGELYQHPGAFHRRASPCAYYDINHTMVARM